MFKHSAFHPLRFDKMHEHCPHCGLQFEVEPGFFIASMYISYAMSVGTVLIVGFGVFYLAHDPPTWIYLLVVTIVLVLTVPLMFRYARVLLLHYFSGISYQPELS
jgi:uncharacterized protein (DUF983 family)